MCSNIVFDYMDDMVEAFEGFIQKSLLAIIIALGVIVASFVYLLKILSERSLESSFSGQEARIDGRNYQNTISREGRVKPRRRDIANEDFLVVQNDNIKVSTAAMAHSIPSYDESVLRLVGLSCCTKPCCKSKSKTQGTDYDRVSKSSDINMAPIIKQEVEYEIQQSRSPIPIMPQDIKLEKPSRSNSRSPLRSPSPKHSTASLKTCPKASSRKSCCSLCCKVETPI